MQFQVGTRELGRSLDALEATLRAEGIRDETVLDLRLVAEEVLTNVAHHAYGDDAEHWIRIQLAVSAESVTLEFTDDGPPFDPLTGAPRWPSAAGAERPIGGLGLQLVVALVDAAVYARRGRQNVLTLVKRLDPLTA
jgi:anti-sigma regulatory factor (Ser/Thr protein kinase)